jgi:hypothetical protein
MTSGPARMTALSWTRPCTGEAMKVAVGRTERLLLESESKSPRRQSLISNTTDRFRIPIAAVHWREPQEPDPVRLLRADDDRQSHRAASKQQQIAPPHSITSSARCSNECGTVRPSALAVLRLINSSNLFGCCTGKSAAFSPFKIRPV